MGCACGVAPLGKGPYPYVPFLEAGVSGYLIGRRKRARARARARVCVCVCARACVCVVKSVPCTKTYGSWTVVLRGVEMGYE